MEPGAQVALSIVVLTITVIGAALAVRWIFAPGQRQLAALHGVARELGGACARSATGPLRAVVVGGRLDGRAVDVAIK